MNFPEQTRMAGDPGGDGIFVIKDRGAVLLMCMASTGMDWDHVSVSVKLQKKKKVIEAGRCPTWEEMCLIKQVFFSDDDTVMQLHPPKEDWVSTHPYCLHLWKPNKEGVSIPRPPAILVGRPGEDRQKL